MLRNEGALLLVVQGTRQNDQILPARGGPQRSFTGLHGRQKGVVHFSFSSCCVAPKQPSHDSYYSGCLSFGEPGVQMSFV